MLAMLAFGAAIDLVAGNGAARQDIVFRLVAGLQLTAAVGFALGLMILPVRKAGAVITGVLGQAAGASVRILGGLLMLALWPSLPAATAVALLIVTLLVPGVASALTAAAVISGGWRPARGRQAGGA